MILSWLRGPTGSVVDYWHSEGVCHSGDAVNGVKNAHSMCRVSMDYTLRMAFGELYKGESEVSAAPEWCVVCLGISRSCVYCTNHSQKSQRERAAEYMLKYWPDAPLRSAPSQDDWFDRKS